MSGRTVPWTKDDAGARAKFAQGHAWQRLPFEYLRAHGFAVDMPALEIRENFADRERFKNQADLWVNGYRVEVKSNPARFTGPQDFPFPHAFTDEKKKFDVKDPKPVAYILVSQPTGGMVCLKADVRQFQLHRGVKDKVRDTVLDIYAVPKAALRTMDHLVEYLKRLGGGAPSEEITKPPAFPPGFELHAKDISW